MKGFINEYGIDVPPCGTCKHKNKIVIGNIHDYKELLEVER